jgi:hypothetical protein
LRLPGRVDTVAARTAFLVLGRDGQGCTLKGRGRDVEKIDLAVAFDKPSCRWRVMGEAAEVRRSDQRTKVLEALREANEPVTPKDILIAAELTNRNALDTLLHNMTKAGKSERAGRGLYVLPGGHPIPPERLEGRKDRGPNPRESKVGLPLRVEG